MSALAPHLPLLLERLAAASLQALVLAGLVWLATRPKARLGASWRAALWWIVSARLLLGLVAPVLELPLLAPKATEHVSTRRLAAVPKSVPTGLVPPALSDSPGAPLPAPPSSRRIPLLALATGAWILALLFFAARGLHGLLRVEALLRRSRPARDPELLSLFAATTSGLRRRPRLVLSDEVPSPFVTGLLRPAIVLPKHLAARLGAPALRMTLQHEVAHLLRHDLWLGLVPAFARAVFFFHPLAWLAHTEYRVAREAACDEHVVTTGAACAHAYARLLVALGASRSAHALTAVGAVTSRSVLRRRLEMLENLLEPNHHRRRSPRLAWALATLVGAAALVPLRLVAAIDPEDPAPPPAAVLAWPPAPRPAPATLPAGQLMPTTSRTTPAPRATAPRAWPMLAGTPPVPSRHPAMAQLAFPAMPPAMTAAYHAAAAARGGDSAGIHGWHESDCLPIAGASDTSWVLATGTTHSMCGSGRDLRAAERSRKSGEDVLWFRIEDDEYVVRDRATLAAAIAIFAPEESLGQEQETLGARQAALGEEQSKIGVAQAELGVRQAELGLAQAQLAVKEMRRARGDETNREATEATFDAEHRELDRKMDELSKRMQALGGEQDQLGARQDALSAEQERLSVEQEKRAEASARGLLRLIEQARAKGLAERRR